MVYSNDGSGWAQSGMIYEYGDSCWRHFAQQAYGQGGSGSYLNTYVMPNVCVGNDESHHVWEQTVPTGCTKGTNCEIRSNIDTTVLIQSSWDPNAKWTTPFLVAWSGETYFDQSDVPGYNTSGYPPPVDYENMEWQYASNDSWYTVCDGNIALNAGTVAPRYSIGTVSSSNCTSGTDHVQSWTSG